MTRVDADIAKEFAAVNLSVKLADKQIIEEAKNGNVHLLPRPRKAV